MIENEIYCYVNGFLKWNIGEKNIYIVGNEKFTGKFAFLIWETKEKVSLQSNHQVLCVKEVHNENGQDHN